MALKSTFFSLDPTHFLLTVCMHTDRGQARETPLEGTALKMCLNCEGDSLWKLNLKLKGNPGVNSALAVLINGQNERNYNNKCELVEP